jgi:hypothetical protein
MLARQRSQQARAAGAVATRAPASSLAAPSHRRRNRCNRRAVLVAASPKLLETDASGRVSGTPASVASYISRVDETWPAWYPRLARATRVGEGKFEVVVRAAGGGGGQGLLASFLPTVDLPVEVELLERSPKRVVFQAISPFHIAQEQYILMPCPADRRGHTSVVRHVSQVRLRGAWAGALAAPVVGGLMAGVPREALERLATALRSEQQQQQQQQQERRQQAGRRRTSSSGSSSGKEAHEPSSSFWGGLFSGAAPGARANARGEDDSHGLYAALALDPRDQPAAEAVRAAYRRRAALLHPDANLGAGADEAERMRREFERVARAYAVLIDGDARRAYDRGAWRPAEGEEDL